MDATAMNVTELKAELKKRGLKASGKKAELAERLQQAIEEEDLLESGPEASEKEVPTTIPKVAKAATIEEDKPTETISDAPKEPKSSLLEDEARKKRAERFQTTYKPTEAAVANLKETEKQKRIERAKRFGLPSKDLELEKKRKRAERFNIVVPEIEAEKKKKRAERFKSTLSVEQQKKAEARKERFKAHLVSSK